VYGDGPYPGLVEEFFVVPVRVVSFQLSRSEVMIAEPDNSPRQQERVLIAARVADLWISSINGLVITSFILSFNSKFKKTGFKKPHPAGYIGFWVFAGLNPVYKPKIRATAWSNRRTKISQKSEVKDVKNFEKLPHICRTCLVRLRIVTGVRWRAPPASTASSVSMRINCNFVTMVGLTNAERCLIHNLRVQN